MRISDKFEKALKEPTTMMVFAKFAAALKIERYTNSVTSH